MASQSSDKDDEEKSTSSANVILLENVPSPINRESIPKLLEPFGYLCNSAHAWAPVKVPVMDIKVSGHRKSGGHTYYHVTVSFARHNEWHSPYASWTTGRRLQHLRLALHDPVKDELGLDYRAQFDGAHFAYKVHVKGTTSRLNIWCKRLAHQINSKQLPPIAAAHVIRALLPEDIDLDEVRKKKEGGSNSPFLEDVRGDGDASDAAGRSPARQSSQGSPTRTPKASPVAGSVDGEEGGKDSTGSEAGEDSDGQASREPPSPGPHQHDISSPGDGEVSAPPVF
eukprot:CAMPEP_0206542116 /NCGR_PEP_ID=MMETSP0325_2-20121206/9993_1 /ASSEMBLY_ACC=CAM_ASM_000347 /TAXON_ID=2866 /ORGANISM="Crypthecodinium cohnii, Strain Seligo" /LENGTH=282 /DNA_ID=CAMNT_0054040137 /DNA_START=42 /DNA_END=887 /DNA_ORIENTATION=+